MAKDFKSPMTIQIGEFLTDVRACWRRKFNSILIFGPQIIIFGIKGKYLQAMLILAPHTAFHINMQVMLGADKQYPLKTTDMNHAKGNQTIKTEYH